MPQEIEVWYTIPALRRELTKSMIEDYINLTIVKKNLKILVFRASHIK